jgi:asparagine synthase (glutamine-hydrolysing)
MCGIAGLVSLSEATRAQPDWVQRMVSTIEHRGPDDRGVFDGGQACLGVCRLSIVDLAGGHQPLSNEDDTLTLVCNGEIYNSPALRKQLLAQGHTFKTRGDVEVILHLYEEHGLECAKHLQGMFAFALWDSKRKRLLVARDRLGIKPLFFAEADGFLWFCSEIKGLLSPGRIGKDIHWEGLDRYFTFGYIPAPVTIYSRVQKLLPAHQLVVERGRIAIEPYWKLSIHPNGVGRTEDLEERLLDLLRKAVRSHLMSDVPLGAFLSGGVDSSLIVALMSEFSESPVNTFTMGFGGQKGGYLDERPFARLVSQRYGTNHTEYEVQPHLDEILERIVDAFDEPFADDSVIPTYYICQLTAQKVKVALTGLGGDELFGGYERYLGLRLSEYYRTVPGFLRQGIVSPIVNRLPEPKSGHYTVNHMKRFVRAAELPPDRRYLQYLEVFSSAERQNLYSPETRSRIRNEKHEALRCDYFSAVNAPTLLDRAFYQDLHTYVPEDILALTDRLSMHHSLELRVPFLDHELVEFCVNIPSSLKIRHFRKKYFLRKIARQLLPKEVLAHRKQGFASPMAAWLRGDLRGYIADSLSEARLRRHGCLLPAEVQRLVTQHLRRRELNDRKIFAVLMFQKWFERHT